MRKAPPVLFLLLAILFGGQAALLLNRSPEASTPSPDPTTLPTPLPTETDLPSPTQTPTPTPTPTQLPPHEDPSSPLYAFAGIGAWVDTYDFGVITPEQTIPDLVSKGVRTLYLQTGRWREDYVIAPEVASWLPAAKQAGLKVVGWYVPSYSDMQRDIDRTVAIQSYNADGERFDAVGVDIEYREEVAGQTWNDRVVQHLNQVRQHLPNATIAAITPPPLQMEIAPRYWAGFPWERIAAKVDAWVLMAYWHPRDCDAEPNHCPEPYARVNAQKFRSLSETSLMPLHLVGGVASEVTADEVRDFVSGANSSDAVGISIYDVVTMRGSGFWPLLKAFEP
ncbi:MAG: hypothetical protein ACLGH3_03350 [Actinomycetota bacterium]